MMALEEICAKSSFTFIPPPADAMTEDGFVKPDYCGADTIHANEKYGELVLRQIEQIVSA